jgi:hypothetical protein
MTKTNQNKPESYKIIQKWKGCVQKGVVDCVMVEKSEEK